MERVEGVLHSVGDTIRRTETFSTRDFVVRVPQKGGRWCDYLPFSLFNEGASQLDGLAPGQPVEVRFVVSGRKGRGASEGRFFNSLDAVKVASLEGASAAQRAVRGVLHSVGEARKPTDTLTVRDFVLCVPGEGGAPDDYLQFQLRNLAVGALDGLGKGCRVEVLFAISGSQGREGRFFNSLDALAVTRL